MENHYNNKQPINQWAEGDRPREKMLNNGKLSLSNTELLAILLGSGNADESALQLAKRILDAVNNNLIEFAKLSINELLRFKGVGKAKAVTIEAALELGKRRLAEKALGCIQIKSSKQAYELVLSELSDNYYEDFYILLLNRSSHLIRKVLVSSGGIGDTIVDPKKIFKIAIDHNASTLILAHNHPTNKLNPSSQDLSLTKKLVKGGNILSILISDHIIVGSDNYFSFADNGLLEEFYEEENPEEIS